MTPTSNKRVFLGGTCNNSTWRDDLVPLLTIDSFNPVVSDWNEAAAKREIQERETCDFCLYVLTPRMLGVYSVAEVVDDSNKRPAKTVLCVLPQDASVPDDVKAFVGHEVKALKKTAEMVVRNGGRAFTSLAEVAAYLNAA